MAQTFLILSRGFAVFSLSLKICLFHISNSHNIFVAVRETVMQIELI